MSVGGSSFTTGCAALTMLTAAGSPCSEAAIALRTSPNTARRTGATWAASVSDWPSTLAAGRRVRITGAASRDRERTSASVGRSSASVVGRMRTTSARSWLRRAVVASTRSPARTRPDRSPCRAATAPNTTPLSCTRRRTPERCVSSTRSSSPLWLLNGSRLPSALLSDSPLPFIAAASPARKRWASRRVRGSNAPSTSSSSTVCATCERASSPPSGSGPDPFLPGVSSTYVSPMRVFCLRIARVSRGIGA